MMPTIRQLCNRVGGFKKSCGYQESRTVLRYADMPNVIAYGLGFAGFVAIYKTGGHEGLKDVGLRATCYSVRSPLQHYKFAGFNVISVDTAREALADTNNLFKELVYNKDVVDRADIIIEGFNRPFLGEYICKQTTYDKEFQTHNYKIYRLSNGELRCGCKYWYMPKFKRYALVDFVNRVKEVKEKRNDWKFVSTTIPKEIMDEIFTKVVLSNI